MLKMMRGVAVVLVVLMVATMSYAERRGRWWHDPHVVQNLNLTKDEVQQLEDTFNESSLKMIKLKSRVEQEQFQLQAVLEQKNLDEAAVKAQNRKLEEARTALANERTAFVVQVRKIIGHERFQKFVDMR